jgi:hypothetical protein
MLRVECGTKTQYREKSTVTKPPQTMEEAMTYKKVVAPVKTILKATYIAEGFTAIR